MNYTDRIHALVKQNLPPSAFPCEHLEGCILQLLQDAVREATNELHQAHSNEVLAHIETKKKRAELEAKAAKSGNAWNVERDAVCAGLHEEISRLRDGWKAAAVRLEKTEAEFREVARALELVREALPPMVPPPGAEPYPALPERVRRVVAHLEEMTACRDAAVKRADENQQLHQEAIDAEMRLRNELADERIKAYHDIDAWKARALAAEDARRNAFKEVRKELEAELKAEEIKYRTVLQGLKGVLAELP